MSRIAALCLLFPACEPAEEPKEVGDTDTDTGDDAGKSDLTVTQSVDDAIAYNQLWASGHMLGAVIESGASGTVAYSEWIDEQAPYCTATLEFESAGPATDCMGCNWSHVLVATEVGRDGECLYGAPINSLMAPEGQEVWLGWYEDYTDDFGDEFQEMLNLVYWESSGNWEMYYPHAIDGDGDDVGGEAYDVATGTLDYNGPSTGFAHAPALWLECDADPMEADAASVAGGTVVSGQLECDWFDMLGDAWTFELAAGDTLHATIDSPSTGAEMTMMLVGPDGCAMAEAVAEARCSGRGGNCPTLSYEAATAGEWTLVVSYDDCEDDPVEYSVDLVVE